MGRQQDGFTVIEVTLFLALSGLLFVIAFTTFNGTIQNVRFDDSRKSLESFLQAQYTSVATNSIKRPSDPTETVTCSSVVGTDISVSAGASQHGRSNSCVVMGVEIKIRSDNKTFQTYPILGHTGATSEESPIRSLSSANPITWENQGGRDRKIDEFVLPWGVYTSDKKLAWAANSANGNSWNEFSFTSVAFLRNPLTNSIDVVFNEQSAFWSSQNRRLIDIISVDASSNVTISNWRNTAAIICLNYPSNMSPRRGVVTFTGDGRGQAFSIGDIASRVGKKGDVFYSNVASEGLRCGW